MSVIARLLIVALVALIIFDPQAAFAQGEKQPGAVGSAGAAAGVGLGYGTIGFSSTLRRDMSAGHWLGLSTV